MSILITILKFAGAQLLSAIITARAVKDATLFILREIAVHTKTKFDDKIYKKVKFYMLKDTSERINPPKELKGE